MTFMHNTITAINTVLCLGVFILGYLGYKKTRNKTALYITIAFGFFAFSHIIAFFNLTHSLMGALIVSRVIAYLVVIFALYKLLLKR